MSAWRLLLTRPAEESAELAATLAARGIYSSSLPLLKAAPLPLPIAPGPGSLALHPQMPALADQLAGQFQLDPAWVTSVIAQGQSSEQVARLIMPASNPGAKNWAAYRARFIEPIRIKAGLQFWRANEAHLKRAESVYGVPADIIALVMARYQIDARWEVTGGVRANRWSGAYAVVALDGPPVQFNFPFNVDWGGTLNGVQFGAGSTASIRAGRPRVQVPALPRHCPGQLARSSAGAVRRTASGPGQKPYPCAAGTRRWSG